MSSFMLELFFFFLLNYICKLYHHREESLSLYMNRDQLSDGVNVTVQLRRTPLMFPLHTVTRRSSRRRCTWGCYSSQNLYFLMHFFNTFSFLFFIKTLLQVLTRTSWLLCCCLKALNVCEDVNNSLLSDFVISPNRWTSWSFSREVKSNIEYF